MLAYVMPYSSPYTSLYAKTDVIIEIVFLCICTVVWCFRKKLRSIWENTTFFCILTYIQKEFSQFTHATINPLLFPKTMTARCRVRHAAQGCAVPLSECDRALRRGQLPILNGRSQLPHSPGRSLLVVSGTYRQPSILVTAHRHLIRDFRASIVLHAP